MSNVRPVILSGGSGTRLWPLSQDSRPKQFLDLFGSETLFHRTLSRAMGIPGAVRPLIVTGERFLDETSADLGEIEADIVLEPQGRNTAAAVIAAALVMPPEDILVVMPSDHLVADDVSFSSSVAEAVAMARAGGIVTLGVLPDRPDTGFGYIRKGRPSGAGFEIDRFVEKPTKERAIEMIADGEYLWNAGLFVGQADVILREAGKTCPGIVSSVAAAIPGSSSQLIRLSDAFREVDSQPFDKAVMEKTQVGMVIPLDAGWSDVGTWKAVWEASGKDDAGNVVSEGVEIVDSNNLYVRASSRPVVVIGLSDVAVVETEDGVLVTALDHSQNVRHPAGDFGLAGEGGAPIG